MTSNVRLLKPHLQFQDTCGVPIAGKPGYEEAVRDVCAYLGIHPSAIQTKSQFLVALQAMAPNDASPEQQIKGVGLAAKIYAKLIVAPLQGRTDLASLAVIRAVDKLYANEVLSESEMQHVERLSELQRQSSVANRSN